MRRAARASDTGADGSGTTARITPCAAGRASRKHFLTVGDSLAPGQQAVLSNCACDVTCLLSAKAVELLGQDGLYLGQPLGRGIDAGLSSAKILVIELRVVDVTDTLPVASRRLERLGCALGVQVSVNPFGAKPVQSASLNPATHDACITQSHDSREAQAKCKSNANATYHG